MRSLGILRLGALLFALAASPAFAQAPAAPATAPARRSPPDNRIPVGVIDARVVMASLGSDTQTASNLFVTAAELKSRAFGLGGGVHLYPLRGKSIALGIGAEAIQAQNSFETVNPTTLKPTGTVYYRRLRGVSGQVSLNFGHNRGWSYLTVGAGPTTFESHLATLAPDGLSDMTLNFGGGARWFAKEHLAFTVALRFYRTPPALATANTASRLKNSVLVMSAGIAIK